jgi:hypothetical protein
MSTDNEPFKQTVRAAEAIDASTSESLVLVASSCECSINLGNPACAQTSQTKAMILKKYSQLIKIQELLTSVADVR